MSERLIASEAQTQKAILDWLQAKRILAFRMNVGVHEIADRWNGKVRRIRYGVPGMADVLAFVGGTPYCPDCDAWNLTRDLRAAFIPYQDPAMKVYWIEVKAIKGRQSDLQKSFQRQVESHGHRYVIARCLEDVQEAIK